MSDDPHGAERAQGCGPRALAHGSTEEIQERKELSKTETRRRSSDDGISMHYCEHSLALTAAEYEVLPADKDGMIPDHAMDAFECGRPAGIKRDGMWLCAEHYDSVVRGEGLSY